MKLRSSSTELSELEGAALATVKKYAPCTPYKVREAFRASPSDVWSGSAGAIYPLMRRLEAEKLVTAKSETVGKRPRRLYALTPKGERALKSWLTDVDRGASIGFDPLRTRLFFAEFYDPDALADYVARSLEKMHAEIPSPEPGDPHKDGMHKTWLAARDRAVRKILKLLRD
ncbi:MAG: hypothetical protein Tsb0010_17080 [Parvularculaceae bacterium]